ncbi:MAG: YciI family protein [Pseudanabaenaceae cyanobacterium SKYGB_i_bin29]|nr:YciI family protein [Pseudanabaenaceae cyanobacterium SKYG29]MDW8420826.1 YciI family protein [Pseudanabaenaceae cyanobacterium SKYGB_i_bin29]
MKKFVLWGTYCEDVLQKRAPFRQAHLDYLKSLQTQGKLQTIGPTQDLRRVFGVYLAEDEAEARALIEADPYWQNQVWTSYEVYEWIQAI